jgi:8-oxo-dGTP pyrophosphatase MutT (NUDIX family)
MTPELEKKEGIVALKAVIRSGDTYLVLLRNSKAFHGLWDFAGGKWKKALETKEDGLKREVWEETGLEVAESQQAFEFHGHLDTTPVHFIIYDVRITGDPKDVQTGEEHSELKFLTAQEILQLPNLMPYMREFLNTVSS